MAANASTGEAKVSIVSRMSRWLRNMRGEMKRVIWPSRKQVFNNTCAVLGFMAVSALVVGAFDMLLGLLIKLAFGS